MKRDMNTTRNIRSIHEGRLVSIGEALRKSLKERKAHFGKLKASRDGLITKISTAKCADCTCKTTCKEKVAEINLLLKAQ
jgi:hypothetical protein